MPVFNRVRIINIRYDYREIKDDLFDYYGGCNALMNLANGSGKTVMVETLFQPIYPNMSVGKWKIIDYLTGDQRPTFVMIEWQLDGTREPTYFMTGICLSYATIPLENQPGRSLKYFTFTHTYTKGNAFDIEHIPLLPKKGAQKYPTYDEVWALLKKYASSHQEFELFRKERKEDYKVHLREHQIFPEEWELLKTINQEENGGGMGKLFETCKTSDLLFDRWILKKISDTNAEQRISLMQALTELTLPMIESDDKLREKEQTVEVADQLHKFEDVFESYTDALDKKEQKERYLAGVLLYTVKCCQQAEQDQTNAQQSQWECSEEEKHIRLEELSAQYHQLCDEIKKAEETVEELKVELPVLQKKAEMARREYRLMQAAEYKSARIRAEQELQTAHNQLRTLEQGDEAERLQNLGFTLRIGYQRASEEIVEKLRCLQKDLQANKSEKERCAVQKKEHEERQKSLIAQQAVLEQRLQEFASMSEKYQQIIGELPETGITGEPTPESVTEMQNALTKALESVHKEVQSCLQQLERTKQAIKDNQVAQEQLDPQIEEAQETLRRERTCMETYQQRIEQITELLHQYEIGSQFLYEKEENLLRMKEKCSVLQARQDTAKREFDRTEEKLEKLKNNCLHTAPQFGRLLEENSIAFQTGEAYLKQQERAFQEQLLARNPLLPFCYLVSDSDYQKALSIPLEAFADRLCPVLRRRDLDCMVQTDEHSATLGELRLYSLYDRESMDPESSGQYAQKLTGRREDLQAEIRTLTKSIAAMLNAIQTVEQFSLTKQIVDVQEQAVRDAEGHVKRLIEEKHAKKEEANALSTQQDTLRNDLDLVKEREKQAEKRLNALQEFLQLADNAANDRAALDVAEQELRQINSGLLLCEDMLGELAEIYQELREKQSMTERERTDSQNKMATFAQYLDGEAIPGDLVQLEMEYQPLYQKRSQSRDMLDEKCRMAQEQISYSQNQLQSRFGDLEDTEIPLQFDGSKLNTLEEREKEAEKKLTLHKQEKQQALKRTDDLLDEIRKKHALLAKEGLKEPLAPQEIKGDYPKRREENERKRKEAQERENAARQQLRERTSRRTALEKLVDLEQLQDDIAPITDEVELSTERKEFQTLQAAAQKHEHAMKSAYQTLCERYQNEDQWIMEMLSFIRFGNSQTYSSCYYLLKQLIAKEKLLQDQIKLLDTELSNIENNRAHIIRQIFEHAVFLFEQVRDISTNSIVTLQGKRRKMLEIGLPDALDSQAQQRIANFVDEVTLKLRQQIVLDAQVENKLFDAICSYYSDRAIFNAYTNLQTIKVRVLKILQDERNSRLENWEARYSGGERFITYFIAYSALADYTRRKANPNQKGKLRSVFLVDNPFGEASSDHLVGTLMEITQKFHMQLICFSDLKQSSITNHFDLIYQLSMRKILYSNKSQLHTDHIINQANVQRDSCLEFVSMNSQLSFLDD